MKLMMKKSKSEVISLGLSRECLQKQGNKEMMKCKKVKRVFDLILETQTEILGLKLKNKINKGLL